VMGLDKDVMDLSFVGTSSRIGGMNLEDLAQETISMRDEYDEVKNKLVDYGYYNPRGDVESTTPTLWNLPNSSTKPSA